MAGIMTKFMYVKNAVDGNYRDEKTVTRIQSLLRDSEHLPVFKVPIYVIAKAALILLGVEADEPDDTDIQWWKRNLLEKF